MKFCPHIVYTQDVCYVIEENPAMSFTCDGDYRNDFCIAEVLGVCPYNDLYWRFIFFVAVIESKYSVADTLNLHAAECWTYKHAGPPFLYSYYF